MIRITSEDGIIHNMRIVDESTGKELESVAYVKFNADARNDSGLCLVELGIYAKLDLKIHPSQVSTVEVAFE